LKGNAISVCRVLRGLGQHEAASYDAANGAAFPQHFAVFNAAEIGLPPKPTRELPLILS
jgi:hypothetical protein